MDIKDRARTYADYQAQIDELEWSRKELGDKILADLEKMSVKKLAVSDIGTFSIAERKSWRYGEEVEMFINQAKEAKRIEENSRPADQVVQYLRFQKIKKGGE